MSQAMIVQTQILSKRYEIKNCVGTSALETRVSFNDPSRRLRYAMRYIEIAYECIDSW